MSYILDALKRAESERSRGAVPNIHAHAVEAGGPDRSRRATWGIGPGGIGLVVVAMFVGLAWWWLAGDEPAVQRGGALAPAPQPAPAPSAALPQAGLIVAPAPSPPLSPPSVAALPVPARGPAVVAALPRTSARNPSLRAEKSGGLTSEPDAASRPASAPLSISPSDGDDRVYALKELPDDIRSSLPNLTVGGATYSENPANRMLIVNGSIFHEGDKLAPELTLHQIRLRAAVLSFRGYRYAISY